MTTPTQPTREERCCEWKGTISSKGYGVITLNGRQYKAHRLSKMLSLGRAIPKTKVIDHLCRNPLCINPDHLDVVTNGENVLRGESFSAKNAVKTHCKYGHLFSEFGFTRPAHHSKSGRATRWRQCRLCNKKSNQASRARLKNRSYDK